MQMESGEKITNAFHAYGIYHSIVRMIVKNSKKILEHVWSTVLVQSIMTILT